MIECHVTVLYAAISTGGKPAYLKEATLWRAGVVMSLVLHGVKVCE